MKRYPLYPLIVTGCGLALTLAGFLPPLIRALTDPPVIIGGADFHSLWFMLSKPPADILLTCGLPLLLTGLVWLIFHRAVERGCHRKTTLYALAVTATGALGAYCLLVWFSIAAFGAVDSAPVAYPTSILVGLPCLPLALLFLGLYIRERWRAPSGVGLLLDILTVVVYFQPFFYCLAQTHSFLSNILAKGNV